MQHVAGSQPSIASQLGVTTTADVPTSDIGAVVARCEQAESIAVHIAGLNDRLGAILQALTGEGQGPPEANKPIEVKPSLLSRLSDAQDATFRHLEDTERLVSQLNALV